MGKFDTRMAMGLITLLILAGFTTGAIAQSPLDYTGCLKARGKLKQLLRGTEPVRPCRASEAEIRLASADTTDILTENMADVITLATEADGRIDQVEAMVEEIAGKVDGNIFVDSTRRNTVVGFEALVSGNLVDNTAVGANALNFLDTPGQGNTAVGSGALQVCENGFFNTAVGRQALGTLDCEIGIDDRNIALGNQAGLRLRQGNDNIYVGSQGEISESGVIRIGTANVHNAAYITGIQGTSVNGDAVVVNGSGQLGIVTSSRRYKEAIEPMGTRSGDLMRLKPVTFRYKEADAAGKHPLEYGLIAEEVAEVYPELVGYSKDGQPRSVRYHKLNSMLLNELQKQHTQLVQQEEVIAQLTARLARVEAELTEP